MIDRDGWMPVLPEADLPVGKAVRAHAEGRDIFLYRTEETIYALANPCTHQGAPLHRGMVRAGGSPKTVTCPLHGSQFQLSDGRVMRGPATVRLAAFEARVEGDTVLIRPRTETG